MHKWNKATRRVKTEVRKIEMNLGLVPFRRKKGFNSSFKVCRFALGKEQITVCLGEEITGYSLPAFIYLFI